jgi:cold shock CspA family protein
MATGKLKMYNRGYGFLTDDERSGIERSTLNVGDRFRYQVEPSRGGKVSAVRHESPSRAGLVSRDKGRGLSTDRPA